MSFTSFHLRGQAVRQCHIGRPERDPHVSCRVPIPSDKIIMDRWQRKASVAKRTNAQSLMAGGVP
jgi:hypothetical protein